MHQILSFSKNIVLAVCYLYFFHLNTATKTTSIVPVLPFFFLLLFIAKLIIVTHAQQLQIFSCSLSDPQQCVRPTPLHNRLFDRAHHCVYLDVYFIFLIFNENKRKHWFTSYLTHTFLVFTIFPSLLPDLFMLEYPMDQTLVTFSFLYFHSISFIFIQPYDFKVLLFISQ